jgi:hypothetical protein
MPEIISRKEALELGLKRYFTEEPCGRGHCSPRYVLDRQCVECVRYRSSAKSRAGRDKRYYSNNREKVLARVKEYYRKQPEKAAARNRKRMERISDLISVLRTEMPELLKEFGL